MERLEPYGDQQQLFEESLDQVRFEALERRLEREPEGLTAEIIEGSYLVMPRPRPAHAYAETGLHAGLHGRFASEGEWLFLVEVEVRHEPTRSRLVPDVAGWRKSTTGWPDPGVTPIELVPEWVAEVLSPGTERFDREAKLPAYGRMGVGWVWLVDLYGRRIETYLNMRGRMDELGHYDVPEDGLIRLREPFNDGVRFDLFMGRS